MSPPYARLTQNSSSAQHHPPTTTDKLCLDVHGPVALPGPYSDPAFAHAKPATGAGDTLAEAAGPPTTAAGTDDDGDGSHASDGFCIVQGVDALIDSASSEASVDSAAASAATTHGTLSNPLSPDYDAAPAAPELRTVSSMGALPQQQQQQQQLWDRLTLPRKAISSHIAGTGTFMVLYQRGPEGGFDGWMTRPKTVVPTCRSPRSTRDSTGDMYVDPIRILIRHPHHNIHRTPTAPTGDASQRRPAYLELPPAEQELMLQEAYQAVLGTCNAMVPGNGLELMDALMETTEVYRKRYGHKKNLFDLSRDDGPIDEGGAGATPSSPKEEEELVQITPTFQTLGGSFWLRKDRYFRRRRSSFTQLARSQRARVIKATYELLQAVGEEFSPGTRLHLMDRVFEHHTNLRCVRAVIPACRHFFWVL